MLFYNLLASDMAYLPLYLLAGIGGPLALIFIPYGLVVGIKKIVSKAKEGTKDRYTKKIELENVRKFYTKEGYVFLLKNHISVLREKQHLIIENYSLDSNYQIYQKKLLCDLVLQYKQEEEEYLAKLKEENRRTVNKKHKIIRILSLCAICFFCLIVGLSIGISSCIKKNSVLLYEENETGYCVYAGKYFEDEDVVIPSIYNGKPVTEIKEEAFKDFANIKTISIPNSITSIGYGAFKNCSSIKEITIPNSVSDIGSGVLNGCSSLEKITMSVNWVSENIDYIGRKNGGTPIGCLFGGIDFTNSYKAVQWPRTYFNSANPDYYYLPNSLKEIIITEGTFYCGFFSGCSSLTSITLLNEMTEIPEKAFYGCSSLSKVESVSNNVNIIREAAFSGCKSLSIIKYNGTKEQWNTITKATFKRLYGKDYLQWDNDIDNYYIECMDGNIAK